MENKRYIDKVIEHLVRGTMIDYDYDKIHYPFPTFYYNLPYYSEPYFPHHISSISSPLPHFLSSFTEYCKNTFGLTDDEIDYVWDEFKTIIEDKLNNGR